MSPATDKLTILFLAANPADTDPLELDEEMRSIDQELHKTEFRDRFDLRVHFAVRFGDLQELLLRYSPHIVHFSGHGSESGEIIFKDGDGTSRPVAPDVLADLFGILKDNVRCVVLNACYSDKQARGIARSIDCVIGMKRAIGDPAAIQFAAGFYLGLGYGRSVKDAVGLGRTRIGSLGLDEEKTPKLTLRKGVDPAQVVLVSPTRTSIGEGVETPSGQAALSPHHRQYLAQTCTAMKRVNLANILETQRREPELLDIYVPLPVDAELVLAVRDRQVTDWWIDTSDGHERDPDLEEARLAGLGRAGEVMGGRERPKTWSALRLDAGDLAPLVEYVRGQMASQIAEKRDTGFGRRGEETLRWRIDVEQAASLQPRMVLIGDPGSGKSSFLRHLALCLAGECLRRAGDTTTPGRAGAAQLAGWLAPADLTPIYIELRALVADFPPLPEPDTPPRPEDLPTLPGHFWPYVQSKVLDARLAAFEPELATLCLDGRAILLLDGLDEVSQADSPERRQQIHHLIQQLTDTYPKLRIVVGSRPYAYEVGDWALDDFGVARLIPLPSDRLRRLAVQLFGVLAGADKAEKQAQRFLEALTRADLDPDIVANPLYFTLWLALWQSTPAPHRLPATTRAGLYGAAVDLLLTHWFRRKQGEIEQALGVPAERLRPVLETLACNLLADERRQDGNRFEFHIAELDAVLRDARAGHRREFGHLDLNVVDGFLAQHAGLLALVSPRPNHYRFLHASFQEYLAACELTCPAPAQRVPPVAPARYFPAGLLHYACSQPDAWWNATHLAADQLLATGRSAELWSLLAELCAPYAAGEGNARAALLAMAVINKLPAGTLPGAPVPTVVTAAARLLADVKHVPLPAQRLTAGDALARLGDPRPGVTVRAGLPDIAWVEIPEFDKEGRRQFTFNDGERDTPHPGLPGFWMAKYPITYAQFQAFVDAPDGYRNPEWREGLAEYFGDDGTRWEQRWPIANRPRENVTWPEAVSFCRWLTAQARRRPDLLPDPALMARLDVGWSIRLPTEVEWVKAARGWDDRRYPWGGQVYESGRANVDESKQGGGQHNLQETSTAGMYPHGASPFGVEEMSGGVWEYCLNKYENPADLDLAGDDRRVVRGGSWYSTPDRASVAARGVGIGSIYDDFDGFRVVCAVSPSLGAR